MELVGCSLAGSLASVIVASPGLPANAKVNPAGTVTGAMVSVSHQMTGSRSWISTSKAVERPRLETTRSMVTQLSAWRAMVFVIASRGSTTSTLTTVLVATGGLPP